VDTVTISLNGREVSGRPGTTVLDLSRQIGVRIPTLCHHPMLKSVGACRICLVEEMKTGRLLASCVTPISEGMEILVDSPNAVLARRGVLELILSDHPSACVVCSKGNECSLRALAKDHGICDPELDAIRRWRPVEEVNSFIVRDLTKCVLCGRCIRVCQDFEAVGAVEYTDRGYGSHPGTATRTPLEGSECTFCGSCVAICPTDALAERDRLAISSGKTPVSGICSYCATGCHLQYEVINGQVVSSRGVPGSPVNDMSLCVRGHYGQDALSSPERLTEPLIRAEDGSYRTMAWNEAVEETAARLRTLIDRHGPTTVGILAGAQCSNEEYYLTARLARAIVGTPNVDSTARLLSGAVSPGLEAALREMRPRVSLDRILNADTIVLVAARPDYTHPVVARNIRRAVRHRGAALVQLDPLKTSLSRFAKIHVREDVERQSELLSRLMKAMVACRLHDEAFVKANVKNADDFLAALTPRPGEEDQPEHIKAIARHMAASRQTVILFGRAVGRATQSYILTRLVANLALLCGRPENLFFLGDGTNVAGAREMGCTPRCLPGLAALDDPAVMAALKSAWGPRIASQRGLDALGMIRAAEAGKLKALLFVGADPLAVFPDTQRTRKALLKTDLVVRTGMFPAVTEECAHIVFPSAALPESDGTYVNIERRVQGMAKVVSAPGSAQPNARFLIDVGGRLGPPMGFVTARDIFDEIRSVLPDWDRLTWADVKKPGGDFPDEFSVAPENSQKSLFVPYLPPDSFPRPQNPPEEFAWRVFPEESPFHPGDGVLSARSRRLAGFTREPIVRMHPADAQKVDFREGIRVAIRSEVGEATARLALDPDTPEAGVVVPQGGPWYMLHRLLPWPEEYCPASIDRLFVAIAAVEE